MHSLIQSVCFLILTLPIACFSTDATMDIHYKSSVRSALLKIFQEPIVLTPIAPVNNTIAFDMPAALKIQLGSKEQAEATGFAPKKYFLEYEKNNQDLFESNDILMVENDVTIDNEESAKDTLKLLLGHLKIGETFDILKKDENLTIFIKKKSNKTPSKSNRYWEEKIALQVGFLRKNDID